MQDEKERLGLSEAYRKDLIATVEDMAAELRGELLQVSVILEERLDALREDINGWITKVGGNRQGETEEGEDVKEESDMDANEEYVDMKYESDEGGNDEYDNKGYDNDEDDSD
jgi:hypothetical protein